MIDVNPVGTTVDGTVVLASVAQLIKTAKSPACKLPGQVPLVVLVVPLKNVYVLFGTVYVTIALPCRPAPPAALPPPCPAPPNTL